METDGFQADTEEDAEDDCVIIAAQNGELHPLSTGPAGLPSRTSAIT